MLLDFHFLWFPQNQARIRVQISAGHSKEQIDRALDAFEQCGKKA